MAAIIPGVKTLAKNGSSGLKNDVTLSEGSNISLNQSGQDIAIAATGLAPSDATYITQTASGGLSAEQALSSLATGYVKNTTGTGVLSVQATPIPVADGGTNATSASITAFNNITGYTASGATGTTSTNLVFSTSPTLTTPNLGTPSSAVLTNATGLPLTTGVSGTLPIANGGTNGTSFTSGFFPYFNGTSLVNNLALSQESAGRLNFGTASTALKNRTTDASGVCLLSSNQTIAIATEGKANSGASAGSGVAVYSNDGAALASGDRLGFFLFGGSVSATALENGGGVIAYTDGTWTTSSIPTKFAFETAPSGSLTRVERLSISSDGTVVVNETGLSTSDFRVEGDTNVNLLFTDASADMVGIKTASPGSVLDVAGSFQCDSITNDTGLAAGTYTPTRSAEANMDSNVTMSEAQYMRVGNTVTVSGRFTADPTLTATATSFEITLPVASNIGATEDVAGVAFCGGIAGMGAEIIGSATNDTAVIQWVSSDVTSKTWSFTFTYQVI